MTLKSPLAVPNLSKPYASEIYGTYYSYHVYMRTEKRIRPVIQTVVSKLKDI